MDVEVKKKILNLRSKGFTYGEIRKLLQKNIAKSTLSYICKNIVLTKKQKEKNYRKIYSNLILARKKFSELAAIKRDFQEKQLLQKNMYLGKIIQRLEVAKIALVMLFLGEGSKTHNSTVMFGNSSPAIVELYLRFFRQVYKVDESKFRCTVQCRYRQDVKKLKIFWAKVTKIPLHQFYKTQIDLRTKDKPMKQLDYKGVCRLDYLSSQIVCDIRQAIKAIQLGGR